MLERSGHRNRLIWPAALRLGVRSTPAKLQRRWPEPAPADQKQRNPQNKGGAKIGLKTGIGIKTGIGPVIMHDDVVGNTSSIRTASLMADLFVMEFDLSG